MFVEIFLGYAMTVANVWMAMTTCDDDRQTYAIIYKFINSQEAKMNRNDYNGTTLMSHAAAL